LQRGSVELVTSLDSVNDPNLEQALSNPRLVVLGIVWNKVDDIMHGMQMQTAGMHNQVRLWASQGHVDELLNRLAKENFAIYVTADHGNVTATGIGIPKEGVLAETKGRRVRVYEHEDFREEVATNFPESMGWPGYGLPPRSVCFARWRPEGIHGRRRSDRCPRRYRTGGGPGPVRGDQ
jgi:hypothetical protein